MTEATETTGVAPIVAAGETKKRTRTKKSAKPKVVTAKKTAKVAVVGIERRSKFADDAEIRVLKTDRDHGLRGKRGDAVDTIKDGTVEKFKAALAKKDLASYVGWALKTALELKLISIK